MIEYADERYYRWLDSIQRMNTIYEQEMEEEANKNKTNTTENEKEN